ncbi:MAG: epoxyqueuosine reductase QueH [Candidatus Aenigmatarchaeota archaeon]
MKRLLLHICCGVCAFWSIKYLIEKGFYVEGFFFNPNIYPKEEYLKRKETAEKVAQLTKIVIHEGDYQPKLWFEICGEYKDQKEGGERCFLCYRLRLEETFKLARKLNFDYFLSTLTISPFKNIKKIIEIGNLIGGSYFLPIELNKEDGFKKTIELAKNYNLYRQNYCGCIYSIRK